MKQVLTTKSLTIINFLIVAYFVLIWLINFYQIDYILIGVFRELLSIPFLIAQLIFLVLGIIHLFKNKMNLLLVFSLLILAISTVFTFGSFF